VTRVDSELQDQAPHDFERLFGDIGPVLWRTIYAYSGGRRVVADDAVAEAFARALERRDTIRKPVPWLYRTAFRLAGEEMRTAARLGPLMEGPAADEPEEVQELMRALRELSPNQRAAIVLHYHADLPVREVSRLMGSSVAAVKVHLHRGRRKLRALLGEEDVTDG
jgi:RNA polymerase sigma-70 factor (ECF subfamily)